jgi:hypothetical protein
VTSLVRLFSSSTGSASSHGSTAITSNRGGEASTSAGGGSGSGSGAAAATGGTAAPGLRPGSGRFYKTVRVERAPAGQVRCCAACSAHSPPCCSRARPAVHPEGDPSCAPLLTVRAASLTRRPTPVPGPGPASTTGGVAAAAGHLPCADAGPQPGRAPYVPTRPGAGCRMGVAGARPPGSRGVGPGHAGVAVTPAQPAGDPRSTAVRAFLSRRRRGTTQRGQL